MIKLILPCLKITSSLTHRLNFRRVEPGVTIPVDSEDQVNDALWIPISEELFRTLEVMVSSPRTGSKVSRSSV